MYSQPSRSLLFFILLLCLSSVFVHSQSSDTPTVKSVLSKWCTDPDCDKNVTQLITSKGYPCEDHTVITPDGYILSLQRIPYGVSSKTTGSRPVVFLQHGLLDSSATWLINSPAQSFGYILADQGFDVWLGNSRGNTYSHSHTTFSDDSKEFWDFTWDQMGGSELETVIDYVLNVTKQSKLSYVGHSQGTMIGFATFTTPSWASKIKLFVALAPVAYIKNCESKLFVAIAETNIAYKIQNFGHYEFLPNSVALSDLLDAICNSAPKLCDLSVCAAAGCDPKNFNESRYQVLFQHYPAGTSTLNMCHYTQQVEVANFTKYDYLNDTENIAHYGTPYPPQYHLSAVTVPMAIFSGGRDSLADPTDVVQLKSELPKNLIVYQEEIEYYCHTDFIWGIDTAEVLYPTVIDLINKYN